MHTDNGDGFMSQWRRWGGAIAAATSLIVAAPVQAAERSANSADNVAYSVGELFGRLAVFAFIGWLIKRWVDRKKEATQYPTTIEPADPPDNGPHLVGLACVHCRQRIFQQGAAALCPVCNQPVHHLDCSNGHRKNAHGEL